ncbi:chemotaxis protein CheW [Desulfobacula toluolica]|uniref:CheW-like protein n=1 Tax=Desulfobacula toluolica (strain DSM 7467 / Tol2) TaxID=651182 RepID=K0NN06_DESTT|nr:chemotaxis protein CheW [Desulfobacula toluolica]CCK80062.1 CheW-like protein [Desulfobacula toluolica Tol2]
MSNNDLMSKKIDWDRIHRHLDESNTAIGKGFPADPDKKIKILKKRAQLLSRETGKIEGKKAQIEIVEFVLAYENYAIESKYISEVYPLKEFTAIPCTPNFVLGIINVRGRIISIIDLKKFFDLPDKGIADFNKVIIISSELNEFGIVVDSITDVRSIMTSEIQPSLPTLTGVREEYLKGILEDRIVVLEAAMILSDSKIIVHEEVDT